jgi:hypothetical protein
VRTDIFSKADPMVGVLLQDKDGEWSPYARTELLIDHSEAIFRRKIFLRLPDDKHQKVLFSLFDDDLHDGCHEAVDPETNTIFLSTKTVERHQIIKCRLRFCSSLTTDHDWMSVMSNQLTSFSAVQNTTCILLAAVMVPL